MREAEARAAKKDSAEFQRAAIDLRIEIGIGHFFAAKLRCGVLYFAYEQSGERAALEEALKQYRRARDIWQSFAEGAKDAYVSDITFGTGPHQRGQWLDRLAAIDEDIAEMEKKLGPAPAAAPTQVFSLSDFTVPRKREALAVKHTPPHNFVPGQPLEISLAAPAPEPQALHIRLHYRHVNQAERYRSAEMKSQGNRFGATIPADYTSSKYPLQYYFELRRAADDAWLFPGLGHELRQQPYFVVSSRPAIGKS